MSKQKDNGPLIEDNDGCIGIGCGCLLAALAAAILIVAIAWAYHL